MEIEREEKLILDLLDYRENKILYINDLLNRFKKPIITLKSNYPGIYKNNPTSDILVKEIEKQIINKFGTKILYSESLDTPEGLTKVFVIGDEAKDIKKISIEIEDNHELGRFVDIDVYDLDGHSLSRTEMGYPLRSCYICNKSAKECSRNKTHSIEELIDFIESSM